MGRGVDVDASAWEATRSFALASLVLAGVVSACWWPVTRYPPGSVVRPMLPVMATGIALVLSGRMAWGAFTLRKVGFAARLCIALISLALAGVAIAWPLGIRAVLGLDMSG